MYGSCWDDSSSEFESKMSGIETESAIGSEGIFIPSSGSNETCHDAGTMYGMKRENICLGGMINNSFRYKLPS